MKQIILTFGLILCGSVLFGQSPRIRLNQITKDSLTGSVVLSGSDSNMVYSRDFFLNFQDSVLIVFGDTLSTTATAFTGVATDLTLTGNGTVGNELKVDTAIIATVSALADSLAGIISSVTTDLTLTGDGSVATPLKVDTAVIATIRALSDSLATLSFATNQDISDSLATLSFATNQDISDSLANLSFASLQDITDTLDLNTRDYITGLRLTDTLNTNSRGFLTQNQTITLTDDATGSGTTSISVTVVDDSHNHTISTLTGIQDSLNSKAALVHTHIISDVAFLQDSLDAKANDADLNNYLLTSNYIVDSTRINLTGDTAYYYQNGVLIGTGAIAGGGGGGSGTVTSITAGTFLSGGTITTSGTIALDTASAGLKTYIGENIGTVDLASQVTGTLPVANGGTGATSLTSNKILVGNGTSEVLQPTNLHWDNTNSRLGIGITAPRVALEVNADQIIDASNVWTSRTSAADNQWLSVTYGNGLFVAVSISGTGNRVMTSPDGINWTARTSAADNSWRSVTYGNGLFVAVSNTGTGNRVMTSPDGINWTARTSAADNSWRSVTYGNGLFLAVSSTGTGNRVMTSPDGITWTARTSAADNQWFSVTYGNGLFVAVSNTGTGNRVMTSPDGINWTARTSAANNDWYGVTYGNGLFVAVSISGTGNRVMTSPDGINWTARTSAADNQWFSVTYGNGLFVAVSITGTGNRVMTSPDGITWTARTSAANNEWYGVTYGNGLFVAVSITGTGNRVMTSGKQYKQDLSHNNIWQGNQYMPFVYNQTTAEAANLYIDTTTGEIKRSTSSIRYKTDVEIYQKGLNDLLNITPVTFKGINDGNKIFAGFIAEELAQNGLTEFVQYDASGKPDAIRYNQMVTILTKSIQELFAIIEELKLKIQILENKN